MLQRFLLDETHSPLMSRFLQASSIFYQNNNNNTRKAKEIHFLICESCFWCASRLNRIEDEAISTTKCPSCNNNTRVESMPISYDEVYKFDYDPKRGVILKFSTVNAST
jgi:hypothetical protein